MSQAQPVAPELVVARLRPNARRMFLPALIFIAWIGGMLWLTGIFREQWMVWLILLGGTAVMVFGSLLPFLYWLARRYTITTRKVVVQHGLFVRVRKELLHSRGYEITVRRAPIQSLFRCGDVSLKTATDELPVVMRDVPHPLLVQSVLQQLVEGSPREAEALIASHGAQTTDATKRFDPTFFDDTQSL